MDVQPWPEPCRFGDLGPALSEDDGTGSWTTKMQECLCTRCILADMVCWRGDDRRRVDLLESRVQAAEDDNKQLKLRVCNLERTTAELARMGAYYYDLWRQKKHHKRKIVMDPNLVTAPDPAVKRTSRENQENMSDDPDVKNLKYVSESSCVAARPSATSWLACASMNLEP